jgi:hypothetical protein
MLAIERAQRCEAVHSALKRILVSKMLLTDLVKEVISFAAHHEVVTEMRETRNALRQASMGGVLFPVVKEVLDKKLISSYAFDILKAQAAQAVHYSVEPAADSEGTYIVKRRSTATNSASTSEDQCANDFHLGSSEPQNGRRTTLKSCTCQFVKAHGCVHTS